MEFDRRRLLGALAGAATGLALPARLSAEPFAVPGGQPLPALSGKVRDLGPAPLQLPPALFARARAALDQHGAMIVNRDVIGLVDFTLASREPRFQLVDAQTGEVRKTWLVAHGSGSDPANRGFVERFSNRPGSNASCQGAFVTSDVYTGKNGRSRRLLGLDPGNNRALERDIVIHGADYVDGRLAASLGRIGRSQGCFAVSRSAVREVLAELGPGRLLFAAK